MYVLVDKTNVSEESFSFTSNHIVLLTVIIGYISESRFISNLFQITQYFEKFNFDIFKVLLYMVKN